MLESYVTRQTDLPDITKIMIIAVSLVFVLIQWVIYPYLKRNESKHDYMKYNIEAVHFSSQNFEKKEFRSTSETMALSFAQMRHYFPLNLKFISFYTIIFIALILWPIIQFTNTSDLDPDVLLIQAKNGNVFLFVIFWLALILIFANTKLIYDEMHLDTTKKWHFIKNNFLLLSLVTGIIWLPFYFLNYFYFLIYLIIVSPHFIITVIETFSKIPFNFTTLKNIFLASLKSWFHYASIYFLLLLLYFGVYLFINSTLILYLVDFIGWHSFFDEKIQDHIFINHILLSFFFTLIFPLIYYLISNQFHSLECKANATDLFRRFETFGNNSNAFEK
jgi:hypothetical protein